MILNTSALPVPPALVDNKENVVLKSSSLVLRNANGRRPRSRANNTPSPVVITREAPRDSRRRRTQSPHPFRFAVEDAEVEATGVATPSRSNISQQSVQLPRHLRRPAFKDISRAALETVDADLKDVPMEYIQEKLKSVGQQLLSVAATTTANPSRDRLPRELEVVVNDLAGDAPTHLFAVFSGPATRISIHPAHALVLAAHCVHLPTLPYSKPAIPAEAGSPLTLPVVPLCVPNPSTFPILLHYLYTKRGDHLLASLLPMPPRDATQSLDQFSQAFAATFTVQALLSHAARVHGLWSNAAALGVFDEKLWRGIEIVWEVLLGALTISTGSCWRTEEEAPSQL